LTDTNTKPEKKEHTMTEQTKTVSTSSLMQENRTFPPSAEVVKRAYINAAQYQAMYERSIQEPDKFWLEQAATLDWVKKPTVGRKYTWDTAAKRVEHTWFEDGQLNISVNCLDRHLKTKANKPAIVWQGEPENDVVTLTYAQLHQQVCKFANVLKSLGVQKGDRVSIYLPGLRPYRRDPLHRLRRVQRRRLGGSHPGFRLQAPHHLEHLAARRQEHSFEGHRRRGAQAMPQHPEGRRR
jgi:hypothetical protein